MPVLDAKRVYFIALDNILRGHNRNNGSMLWKQVLPVRPFTGPLLSGETLIVTGVAAELHGYNTADGKPPAPPSTLKGAENEEMLLAAPPYLTAQDSLILVTKGGQVRAVASTAAPPPEPRQLRPLQMRRPDAPPTRPDAAPGGGKPCAVSTAAVARPLRRIYLTGLVCAALAASAGIVVERARFGPNDQNEALARVERSVRGGDRRRRVGAQRHRLVCGARAGAVRHRRRRSRPARGRCSIAPIGAAGAHGRRVRRHGLSAERRVAAGVERRAVGDRRRADSRARNVFSSHAGRSACGSSTSGRCSTRSAAIASASSPPSALVSSSRGIRTAAPEEGVLSLPTLVPVTVRPHDRTRRAAPGFVVQSPLGQPLLVARVTPRGDSGDARAMARKHLGGRPRDSRAHADRRTAAAAAVA